MNFFSIFVTVLLRSALVFAPAVVLSQEPAGKDTFVLHEVASLPFPPQDVFFFISFDDGPVFRGRAFVVQVKGQEGVYEDGEGRVSPGADSKEVVPGAFGEWVFLLPLDVPEGSEVLERSAIIVGAESRFLFLEPKSFSLAGVELGFLQGEELRDAVREARVALRTTQEKGRKLRSELLRLESDAALIGRFDRLAELSQEVRYLQERSRALDEDSQALQQFLLSFEEQSPPVNVVQRERELAKQVRLLAEAAKAAEEKEEIRAVESKQLQELLAQTRYQDVELLQEELIRLRKRRQSLEKRFGKSSSGVDIESDSQPLG